MGVCEAGPGPPGSFSSEGCEGWGAWRKGGRRITAMYRKGSLEERPEEIFFSFSGLTRLTEPQEKT